MVDETGAIRLWRFIEDNALQYYFIKSLEYNKQELIKRTLSYECSEYWLQLGDINNSNGSGWKSRRSVSSMLETLGWPTLESRRQKARLSMLHKIRIDLVHCPSLQAKLVPLPSRQRRGHDQQFCLIPSRTQYRGSSFLPRTIRDWNGLSQEAVVATALDTPNVSGVQA